MQVLLVIVRRCLIIAVSALGAALPGAAEAGTAQEVFAAVSGSVVVVVAEDAGGDETMQGSGVVVGANEVATNCHVVTGASAIKVRQAVDTHGHETYRMTALVVARNETRDLCLLFVEELSDPPAAVPVSMGGGLKVSIGEEVYAIGAPKGLELSISRGIVSQLRGVFGKRSAPLIQTDAAISPGSSGGGLFNGRAELIGITTFKFSEGGAEGLSFAVPAEWVAELQAQAPPGEVAAAMAKVDATRIEPFGPEWSIAENQPCHVWNDGMPEIYQSITWSGGCIDGKASGGGHMIARLRNGEISTYEGGMRGGKLHGWGTFAGAPGYRYVGEWRNGKLHGYGTHTWPDGDRYEGEWRDDEAHGRGTHTWPGGERYEGEFRDGKRHGWGIFVWSDGKRHEGEFRDDEMHGYGTHTWPDGARYEGEWHDGKRHGWGIFVWPDGKRYEGEWHDEKRHGRGIFVWPDGKRYEGEWHDEKWHGWGTFTGSDGGRVTCEYRDGNLVDETCVFH